MFEARGSNGNVSFTVIFFLNLNITVFVGHISFVCMYVMYVCVYVCMYICMYMYVCIVYIINEL